MNEVNIPCVFYFYVHSKLWERAKRSEVEERLLANMLSEWRIPKHLRRLILKELEMLGLIEKKNRFLIKINKPEVINGNMNKFFDELKIYH